MKHPARVIRVIRDTEGAPCRPLTAHRPFGDPQIRNNGLPRRDGNYADDVDSYGLEVAALPPYAHRRVVMRNRVGAYEARPAETARPRRSFVTLASAPGSSSSGGGPGLGRPDE